MRDTGRKPKTWRILIADDNDDHALLIQMALERVTGGHLVLRRARDGSEAVAMVAQEIPDLLLLDLHMPGLSGHEVLERLKGNQAYRSIPVAVLTSSDRDEDVAQSYGLGGNHFITKPGNPAQLDARLQTLFKNLQELQGISRSATGMGTTAGSAEGPATYAFKKALPAIGFVLLFGALLVWAWATGILQN